ncbi:MAG: extracellular solute-binding protein, partial [Chloroflexota bacterium]
AAGPLLQVDSLFFNTASSNDQARAATTLAQFLTNIEQSTTFMRELGRIPVNRRVSVNANVYPAVSGFLSQIGTSVALPDAPQVDLLLREGDDAMIRVLEGILEPVDAATRLTQTVNDALGMASVRNDTSLCQQRGTIRLWDDLSGETQDVFQTIMQHYMRDCPDVVIERTYISQDLLGTYIEAVENDIAPDMVILASDNLADLLAGDAIIPIPQDRLESYLPQAQVELQRDDRTYGVPISLDFSVLYFNTQLVNVPATTMDELLNGNVNGVALGIRRDFAQTFWGMTAFGAIMPGDDNNLEVNTAAMEDWFLWLQAANTDPLVVIQRSDLLLNRQFEEGRLGYVVSSSEDLASFEAALLQEDGTSSLGIAQFPSGAGGVGQSALHTEAFFITAGQSEATQALALDFALFATNTENQMLMLEQTRQIPANVGIMVPEDDVLLETLIAQINNTLTLPDSEAQAILLREGRMLTVRLLAGQIAPAEAAQMLSDAMQPADSID